MHVQPTYPNCVSVMHSAPECLFDSLLLIIMTIALADMYIPQSRYLRQLIYSFLYFFSIIPNGLYILFSFQSHFSIKRAGALLGIGTDNVILIKVDER